MGTDVTSAHEETLITGYTGRLLLTFSAGTTAILTGQFVLSPLLPTIMSDLGISSSEAGLALSVLYGVAALFHYPGGKLSDDLSKKTILTASLAIVAGGALQLVVTASYATLLVAVATFGAGLGLYQTSGLVLISDLFERKQGIAFGINSATLNLGGMLSGGLAAVVLASATWRAAFVPIVVVVVVVFGLMNVWNREPHQVGVVSLELRSVFSDLVRNRRILLTVVTFVLFMFVFQGSINFVPSLLIFDKGFSPRFAQYAFGGIFLVSMFSNLLSGTLGDRSGYLLVGAASIVLTLLGLCTLVLTTTMAPIGVGLFLYGLGSSAFWPVMYAQLVSELPSTERGGLFGASRTLFTAIGSFGTTYVGVTADRLTYSVAFGGLVACLLLSLAIVLWLRRG